MLCHQYVIFGVLEASLMVDGMSAQRETPIAQALIIDKCVCRLIL